MTPMTNLIPTPYISVAETLAEILSKPTISAIVATKIQKLISTERIPRRTAASSHPLSSPPSLSRWAPSVNHRIRTLNF